MPSSSRSVIVAAVLAVTMIGPGCQRAYYYRQADQEAAALIAEK